VEISIRPLTPDDADAIEQLYSQSAAYLRALGDETDFRFNAQVYQRDGFGPNAAFSGIGAVLNGHLAGYLLYTFGYDTDRAIRYVFVLDVLVDEPVRGQGIGKALMKSAASLCEEAGGSELFWAVYEKNERAKEFYRRLGAEEVTDLRFMRLRL
jgi:GNAT superfamily N-acetyltransferase